jgi:hypothetical protein
MQLDSYDGIVLGDKIRAYGNATGIVVSIDENPGGKPVITYEAVYDIPAFRVKAGSQVKCSAEHCRKIGL